MCETCRRRSIRPHTHGLTGLVSEAMWVLHVARRYRVSQHQTTASKKKGGTCFLVRVVDHLYYYVGLLLRGSENLIKSLG